VNYPNVRQSLFLMLVVLSLQLLFMTVIASLAKSSGYAIDSTLSVGVVNLAAFSIILFRSLKHRGNDFFAAYEVKEFNYLILVPLTLFVFGLSILLSEADNLTRAVFPMPKAIAAVMESLEPGPGTMWISILTLSVVAPFTEELFFRGLVFKGLMGSHSKEMAMVISALFFALFHMNPWQFIGAFLAGLFFAWLFIAYGSVLPCIIAHALNNFIPILFTYLLKLDIPGFTSSLDAKLFQPAWFDLGGAGLILIALLMFSGINRRSLRAAR
jgi:uncharacterized protein